MAHIPSNAEIARVFFAVGEYLAMDDVPFKPRAYERVAETIEALDRPVVDIYNEGGLKAVEDIPGVGESIAKKIEELLRTGRLRYYERIKKKMPVDLEGLSAIEGVGPKTIKLLWKRRKIRDVRALERAALAGELRTLPRFSAKVEQRILNSIAFHKRSRGRFLLGAIDVLVRPLVAKLEAVPGVTRVIVAGSYRRRQETIGDIDILAEADRPAKIIDAFVKFASVDEVLAKGPDKANVRLAEGVEADLRVLPKESFGAALQYFTGDKNHNIAVRNIAIKKGWKLSEYGLFKGERRIAGATEEEIYAKLGMDWMPPEIRTASGEVEAALKRALPKLIPYGSLRGDLQVQTDWTDGSASIAEMAAAAKAYGLAYIAITDHTRALAMTGGLTEKDLESQGKEIDALNRKLTGFRILKSAEVNIMPDGTLDIADAALKMLFHPTGRKIGKREPYALDILKVLRAAKAYGVAMEVNGSMDRLDLRDAHVRDAVKLGVKLVIDSDAHAPTQFPWLELGLAQARRGWATKADVLNTLPCEAFLKKLKGLKK